MGTGRDDLSQLNPGDAELLPCSGPGPEHFLAVGKFPRLPLYTIHCETCGGEIRITEEMRAKART